MSNINPTLMKKIILLLSLLSFIFPGNAQLHGVGANWGAEYLVPKYDSLKSQRGELFSNMVISSTNRIFISTTELNPLNQLVTGNYISYSDNDGITWSPQLRLQMDTMIIGGSCPKLAIDGDNRIYVMYTSKVPAANFLIVYDQNLNILIDSVRINSMINYNAFTTHLTIDKSNRLHAIWHEGNQDIGDIGEVYHCRSTNQGNTWSTPVLVSSNDGFSSLFPRAQFDAAFGDTLAIAWRDTIGIFAQKWDIMVSISTNGGQTWGTPIDVVSGADLDSDPDIIMDELNRIHLIHHKYPVSDPFDGANVQYAYSDNLGVSWTPLAFQQLSDLGARSHLAEGNRYDAVNNVLWMVWKDERDFNNGIGGADMVISYSLDRGDTWSTPEFVTDWDSLSIGFKAGALFPNGDFGVNYEVTDDVTGLLQVYFKKRTIPNTGIEAIENKTQFLSLYPNPASVILNIEFMNGKEKELTITNALGEIELNLNTIGKYANINISSLTAGIYFLIYENNCTKFIVKQ